MNNRNQALLFPAFAVIAAVLLVSIILTIGRLDRYYVYDPYSADLARTSSESGSIADSLDTVEAVPEGVYNYGGSTTMLPIRLATEPLIEENFPNFRLRYTNPVDKSPSSGTGIEMLLRGALSFSNASRPIRPKEYEAATQEGFELKQIPVAIDGIAIVINPQLNLDGLTIEQLGAIYQGQITNWAEVGGPNLSILPLSKSPSTSGTASFFVKTILDGEDLSSTVQIVTETTPTLRTIAENSGSIYYASASLVVPQCTVKALPIATAPGRPFVAPYQDPLVPSGDCPARRNQLNTENFRTGTYPLTRRLFVVTKNDQQDDESAGEAYSNMLLSAEGQALIEEAGFVRVR
ncbi:MAG: PstS family phosphate ABC transporter substrate-binding protein [Cyanobacteria bacterium J06636_16]